ncbi:hypothetical protein [Yersinia artesiana]|uniref:hypothetical protein n=1 Tax=Yersinia artesiana TaxID=2890315 RepID=UPI001F3DCDC8|nr:hypothetical protein [Yersinia artesiana]
MRVSASQLNVHHSHLDELNNDIKNQVKIITENYNGKECISELNIQNVADKYGVNSDIAQIMLDNDIGDYTMVAKLVILQREKVSFSEINKFAKNHDGSMEGFFSTLLTNKSFKVEYLLSDFKNKVSEKLNYISDIVAPNEPQFSNLYLYIADNVPEYKDLVLLSYYGFSQSPVHELAMLMVLKDIGASKDLLELSYKKRFDYAPVYVALNYEGGQEKIMELSKLFLAGEIGHHDFVNRIRNSLSDLEIDDNRQGEDTGQPLLKEAIPRNLYTSELDINFLTNTLSAILDNSEPGATNFSPQCSKSLANLGNMLAVS